MNYLFALILFCSGSLLHAQERYIWSADTLFPVPGYPSSTENTAPLANCRIEITPDSILIFVSVTDNKILGSGKQRDQVELWFATPETDFSDFISGEFKGKSYLFRNSDEAGDNADLKLMLQDGDYPGGILTDPINGKPSNMLVPPQAKLQRENVFAGITHFICPLGNEPVLLADRDKYRMFENQTGYTFGNPEKHIRKMYQPTEQGYKLEVRMSVQCLGFIKLHGTKQIRTAIEIVDSDHEQEKAGHYATAKNLFYARPWYFNLLELPFLIKPKYDSSIQNLVEKIGLLQDLVFTNSGWKPFGLSKGPILYAKEYVSETGLMQYLYYPVKIQYEKSASAEAGNWERLDVQYDDITVFEQNEVYFLIGNQVVSGKIPGYDQRRNDEFVNRVFYKGNNTYVIALYDYEPNDPLGFGEYGLSADEYYSVFFINSDKSENLFNSGERLKAAGKINLGEENGIERDHVKKTRYTWINPGTEFSIKITYSDSRESETITYKIGSSGKFEMMN
jgi:hypothetical protein